MKTEIDFERLLQLSGLRPVAEEKEELRKNLEQMAEYTQMLKMVPRREAVAAKKEHDSREFLRDDEGKPSMPREQILQNGPDVDGDYFVVPRSIG